MTHRDPAARRAYEIERSQRPERQASNRVSRLKHIERRRQYDRDRYQQPERRAWQKQQALGWARANKGKGT